MKANRLPGHSLPHEGRVLDGVFWSSGPGVSVCTCGTPSPNLPNANRRIAWHRDHKDGVRSEIEVGASDFADRLVEQSQRAWQAQTAETKGEDESRNR